MLAATPVPVGVGLACVPTEEQATDTTSPNMMVRAPVKRVLMPQERSIVSSLGATRLLKVTPGARREGGCSWSLS